eukprot:2447552-Pyramimonas_sp.AAC.1
MRVVRRVCDRVNFDGTAGSDIHAREHAGTVSIYCKLLQEAFEPSSSSPLRSSCVACFAVSRA